MYYNAIIHVCTLYLVIGCTLAQITYPKPWVLAKGKRSAIVECVLDENPNANIHWYQCKKEDRCERILYIAAGTSNVNFDGDSFRRKFAASLKGGKSSLTISKVTAEDSALYYCAYYQYHCDDDVKIFGSGTRLIVSDTPKKAPAVIVYPPPKPQDGKTALVCIAKGMYPAFVRFKWKEEDREIPEAAVLAHEIQDGSASILIIDESKAGMKHTCQVEHEIPTKEWEIPKRTGTTEREDPKGPVPQDNPRGLCQPAMIQDRIRPYQTSLFCPRGDCIWRASSTP
ncbi:hypothetical protein COCON_G00132260 [Conger conger]|uniref:Ig-like domain-containing protein n=1 Tax=Conger conger TaxID=82655 RepID=A0A9Q1DE63_CONCO|nr:hypothetical protein COCON_G00132260 [Conger conger]